MPLIFSDHFVALMANSIWVAALHNHVPERVDLCVTHAAK